MVAASAPPEAASFTIDAITSARVCAGLVRALNSCLTLAGCAVPSSYMHVSTSAHLLLSDSSDVPLIATNLFGDVAATSVRPQPQVALPFAPPKTLGQRLASELRSGIAIATRMA